MHIKIWLENFKERNHLEELSIWKDNIKIDHSVNWV